MMSPIGTARTAVGAAGRGVAGIAGVAGLLAVVELAGVVGLSDPATLPRASTILAGAAGLAADAAFVADAAATVLVWLCGLGVAVVLAVPAGVLLGRIPAAEAAARLPMELMRPIPSVALIPLVAVTVASEAIVRVSVVAYAALWPVLINTMYGVRNVDPVAADTLRAFGFGPVALLMRLVLPSAAPQAFTGVRLAGSIALVVTVSAELVAGATHGIGVFILRAAGVLRTDVMLGAIVWAALLGLTAETLLTAIQRRVFGRHRLRPAGTL